MQEIDKISGLPKDLFDISDITKEQQKIKIEKDPEKLKAELLKEFDSMLKDDQDDDDDDYDPEGDY